MAERGRPQGLPRAAAAERVPLPAGVRDVFWFERDAGKPCSTSWLTTSCSRPTSPTPPACRRDPSESPSPRDVVEQARATWTTRSPARCCSTRRRACTSSIRRPARERRAGRRHRPASAATSGSSTTSTSTPPSSAPTSTARSPGPVQMCPVARSDAYEGGYWVATKYEDVLRIAQDWETWSNQLGITVGPGTGRGPRGDDHPAGLRRPACSARSSG